MVKKLLVVIDMQKDFVDGALGTAEALGIVRCVAAKIAALRPTHDVAFTLDTHGEDYLSTQEGERLPVMHCISGTDGHELIDEVAREVLTGDMIFQKGAFGSVDLAKWIKERGYADVTLVGVCTDICVISNALLVKAFAPEARVTVDAGCCAGVTPEAHRTALAAMAACQIDIDQ